MPWLLLLQLKQKARGGMGSASDMDETTGQGNMGQGFGQGFDNAGSGPGKQFVFSRALTLLPWPDLN